MALKERLVQTESGPEHQMTNEDGKSVTVALPNLMDMLKTLIVEMKKPDELTQKKLDEDAARQVKQREEMIRVANIELANKKSQQARCSHVKENGRTLFMGQIHSDGLIHPICFRCQKELKPYEPPRELVTGMGIN